MKMWQGAAVVFLAAHAYAAEAPSTQFSRSGSALACGKPLPADTNPSPPYYTSCLRTGAIGIGDDVKAVETHLGPALEPPRESSGRELRLYSYDPSTPSSYIVVGYEGGKAVSIQVVGQQPAGKHAFAGVEIGDPIAQVLKTIGYPTYQRCNLNIQQEVWIYEPFPFYINFSEGTVAGFRLAAAPEFEGPFEPLKRLERLEC